MPLLHAVMEPPTLNMMSIPKTFRREKPKSFIISTPKNKAIRILLRFVQKHAKRQSFNKQEDNRAFSDHWYANYGTFLISALIHQFAIKTTKKVRYFQLKYLQSLIDERPEAVKEFAEAFQYDILLRYLRLHPED